MAVWLDALGLNALEAYAPATLKLMPWLPKQGLRASFANVPELLAMSILGRELIGATRVAAAAPALNPNKLSKREKAQTALEMAFQEGLGTVAGFVALQGAQDGLGFALGQLNKALHPCTWLHTAKSQLQLSAAHTNQLEQALCATFKVNGLQEVKNPLTHLMYRSKGSLAVLEDHLANPALFNRLKPVLEPAFKAINQHNTLLLLAGMVVNVAFTGFLWQKLNDGLVRKHVIPFVLNRLGMKEDSKTTEKPIGSSLRFASVEGTGVPVVLDTFNQLSSSAVPAAPVVSAALVAPSVLNAATVRRMPPFPFASSLARMQTLAAPLSRYAATSDSNPSVASASFSNAFSTVSLTKPLPLPSPFQFSSTVGGLRSV